MNYAIKDQFSLNNLRTDKTLKRQIRSISIELDISECNLKKYNGKINRYYFACGCASGRIAVLCATIFVVLLWLIDKDSVLLIWWKILLFVFVSAIIGKAIGLIFSYYMLHKIFAELESLMKKPD